MSSICPGCGGRFADIDGPVHAYMTSSPGCWQAYGQVLAHEYTDKALFDAIHRLSVDAYALQHPGDLNDRRANQSVIIHYVSLFLIFEENQPHEFATRALKKLSKISLPQRPHAPKTYDWVVGDIDISNVRSHKNCVKQWAQATYQAWSDLEPIARSILSDIEL